MPPHGFLASSPQAHPYMWGVQVCLYLYTLFGDCDLLISYCMLNIYFCLFLYLFIMPHCIDFFFFGMGEFIDCFNELIDFRFYRIKLLLL